MNPTPQTDEMELAYEQRRASLGEVFEHARELERELAELKSLKGPSHGGPAFPTPDVYHPNGEVEYGQPGMSLRDWVAGQALPGIAQVTCSAFIHRSANTPSDGVAANWAYAFADAMLKASTK